jgi:hypothetical protein
LIVAEATVNSNLRVYEQAQDLWPVLVKQSGLDIRDSSRWWRRLGGQPSVGREDSYDTALVDDLRDNLFPGATGSLQTLLKNASPSLSAERLLRSFLQVLAPFSRMKRDILEMMVAAGASHGDDNLRIRFQFNEAENALDLLLNEFREQMEVIERRATVNLERQWDFRQLWGIWRIAEDLLPKERDTRLISDADLKIAEWVRQSRISRRFEEFPDEWATGISTLDQRLAVIVNLVGTVIATFRRYGDDYNSARQNMERFAGRVSPGGDDAVHADAPESDDPIGIGIRQLYGIESDYWLGTVGAWILRVRSAVAGDGSTSATVAAIESGLDKIVPPVLRTMSERDELVQRLTDILNLPVWKQRHAVYAVWIGSQIWKALRDDWKFQFHVYDNTLSFAFSGVHLATLSNPQTGKFLDWWTELQTPSPNLPSGHRSRGIQPDYRIRRPPFSAPDSDVLIVEVKQYKRSSTDNFSAALADYAFACRKAAVVLANYGPISDRVLLAVPPPLRPRTTAFAGVRPDMDENCRRLMLHMRGAVKRRTEDVRNIAAPEVGRAELTWKEYPTDLDLHLFRRQPDGSPHHVYFSQRESGAAVRLLADVTRGFGPEVMLFEPSAGSSLLCVNQFSDEGSLAASGARVAIFADREGKLPLVTLDCPTKGSGRWWVVCEINNQVGSLQAIGQIVDTIDEFDPTISAEDDAA